MSIENLKQSAANGSLVLHLEDGAIDAIIAACGGYVQALEDLRRDARDLAGYPLGFAEAKLPSGATLAQAFQHKASGSATSADNTFQSHIDQVEEMKSLFAALRKGYKATDANNANSFGQSGR
ncbi:hypothetical protein [Mycobacteroides chelonae]|uniref:hypothetical protein n=1 Tax=Mycobacteroides chelonae TaxID=1774 RepID=UPI0008A87F01|nr:hypothetical protein [Mycobacteroides chelonae]OHU52604.1 hypothetical protein BKG81_01455 [Mycobacteroides chelonae]